MLGTKKTRAINQNGDLMSYPTQQPKNNARRTGDGAVLALDGADADADAAGVVATPQRGQHHVAVGVVSWRPVDDRVRVALSVCGRCLLI